MKFTLLSVNDCDFREIIEINTLEDLQNLQEKYKEYELVIYCPKTTKDIDTDGIDNKYICPESDGCYIEIYDNYRD